jgi:predicted kinase
MKTLILSSGIPGCGKTTYLRNLTAFQPSTFISSDLIRQEVTGNMSDLSQDRTKVWPLAYQRLTNALNSNTPETNTIVFDTTGLTQSARKNVLSLVKDWGQALSLKVKEFMADVDTCIQRQQNRERKVPEPAMRKMAASRQFFTPSEAPTNAVVSIEQIPTQYALPQATRPISLPNVTSIANLESRIGILGFWREGNEWCSARAAKLVFSDTRSKQDAALEGIIQTLIQKGFAESVPQTQFKKIPTDKVFDSPALDKIA